MPFNILSVDDEMDMQELLRQKFRRQIRKNELQFFHASHGQEALDILMQHPEINMVLADINMPIMDGLTLLNKVAKLNRPLLKIVMLSAYGDMRNIRMAMNRGAFDFINKPIDFSDLEATIIKTEDRIKYLKNQQIEIDRLVSMENEIKAAAQIQASLLPSINGVFRDFTEVQIGSFIKPARYVGGDFYDVFEIDSKHLGFLIADVSGKGISAAAFMLISHTAINIFAHQGLKANEVLKLANNYIAKENKESMFTTTFYGILDVDNGLFSYSNGGHNSPLLLSNNNVTTLERTSNPALGVIEGIEFGLREINLNKGDQLVMFTDGVSEAQNLMDEEFGEERMEEIIAQNAQILPMDLNKVMFNSLEIFRGYAEQFDDITLLSFRWK